VTRIDDLANAIKGGDRGALARAITLVESRRDEDVDEAGRLLEALLPSAGGALRVGITGAPGVGKSTLIERLGLTLCDAGRRVAVLAVDPSSVVTGGSILGDKTRMDELSRRPDAFIRPSPGGGTLGGVASRTQEAALVCEAAGYDVVLVETIGTGQSEVAVHGMVDFFLVMLSPAAGDELQGIKRGVMELADGVLVHKADGDLLAAANRTAQQCMVAMRVLHAGEPAPPAVLLGSSVTGDGLAKLWQAVEDFVARSRGDGAFDERRRQQAVGWLERSLRDALLEDFLRAPEVAEALERSRRRVADGEGVPSVAARDLLRRARGA
jgi:LAO/AO transport system kinase